VYTKHCRRGHSPVGRVVVAEADGEQAGGGEPVGLVHGPRLVQLTGGSTRVGTHGWEHTGGNTSGNTRVGTRVGTRNTGGNEGCETGWRTGGERGLEHGWETNKGQKKHIVLCEQSKHRKRTAIPEGSATKTTAVWQCGIPWCVYVSAGSRPTSREEEQVLYCYRFWNYVCYYYYYYYY
jgi:hypothetical protein